MAEVKIESRTKTGKLIYHDGNTSTILNSQNPNIKYMAEGNGVGSMVAVDIEDNIWAWSDDYGDWGPGTIYPNSGAKPPHIIPFIGLTPGAKVLSISNNANLLVHFDDGTLWGMGQNASGELGLGHTSIVSTPLLLASDVLEVYHPKSYANGRNYGRTFIKKTNGYIYATGYNGYGQLGIETSVSKTTFTVVPMFAPFTVRKVWQLGTYYGMTFFETTDNKLYACGNNSQGQLGTGNTASYNIPQDVTNNWGGTFEEIRNITGVSDQYGRVSYVHAKYNGIWEVRSCGFGSHGNHGNANTSNISTPNHLSILDCSDTGDYKYCKLVVGGSHATSCFFYAQGTSFIKAWGYNAYGQLGTGDNATKSFPTDIVGVSNVEYIQDVYMDGNAVENDSWYLTSFISTAYPLKRVLSSGYNGHGQLGINNPGNRNTFSQVQIPTGNIIISMSHNGVNAARSLSAVDTIGNVWTWGYGGRYMINNSRNWDVFVPITKTFGAH